jgi:hypothetical protein
MRIENGHRVWRNEVEELHREDGPAKERADGDKIWYLNGRKHREDGPAVELDRYKAWYIHGQQHREDGPAVEFGNGTNEWWVRGQNHREGGPAVVCVWGKKEWYLRGKLHRTDGPAREFIKEYDELEFIWNDYPPSMDRPETDWKGGKKEWWVYGKQYTQSNFINNIVQHHLKLHLLKRILPTGAENLVDKYVL